MQPTTQPEPIPMNAKEQVIRTVRQMLPMILFKIVTGATAEDVADLVSNPVIVTDAQFDCLVEILDGPDWDKELFGDPANIAPHRAWFEKLRSIILEQAKEEQDAATPTSAPEHKGN